MAQYFFKVPVIVKYHDEGYESRLLPTHEEVSAFVAEDMMNDDLTEYFYSDKAKSLTATADGDSVRVMITAAGKYSNKTAKLLLDDLDGQCSDGWGENGWELRGIEYGYGHGIIYVYPWEHDKRVTIMTPEEAKIGVIDKRENTLSNRETSTRKIVEHLEAARNAYGDLPKSTKHDSWEALEVALDKALATAKNVLR
jgi:hypothetical protein